MKNRIKTLGKIFLPIFLSFLISYIISQVIFLGNTLSIRPNIGDYLGYKVNLLKRDHNILTFLNIQNSNNIEKNLEKGLRPIAKGVNAASNTDTVVQEYNISNIDWVSITFTLSNGRVVTLRYPKGTEPPTQQSVENSFNK